MIIRVICPAQCLHIFDEVMYALCDEIRSLASSSLSTSISSTMTCETMVLSEEQDELNAMHDCVFIVFGCQFIRDLATMVKRHVVVVYNLEQVHTSKWSWLIPHLSQCTMIWDYSSLNVDIWRRECPHVPVHFVPIGYSPSFEKISSDDTSSSSSSDETSYAFIGNMSPRRQRLLSKISPPVTRHTSVYGKIKEECIARHRRFLNIHYYDESPRSLETVRIVPLVCQRKIVVSEPSDDADVDGMLKDVVIFRNVDTDPQLPRTTTISDEAYERFKEDGAWSQFIDKALVCVNHSHLVVATLHCNNRESVFEVIDTFAQQTISRRFTWVVLSQGCTPEHNEQIRDRMNAHGVSHVVLEYEENMGWSRGMNTLYDHLKNIIQPEYVLHLEDDWLCETTNAWWLDDCVGYMDVYTHVSTLFLRTYKSDQEKWDYGWRRSIWYMCFTHSNPFHYAEKMTNEPVTSYKRLRLQRIPEFLYSANPTLFRLNDYMTCGVFPFDMFQDSSSQQKEWSVTTQENAPQWGYAEALAMEKIRHLTCMNVDRGLFYHRF